jgi:uncharacterized protein
MKFHLYRDRKKEWRWRLTASNGRKIANSGEGYKRKIDMVKMIDRFTEVIRLGAYAFEERK